jgi:dimethylglycine catabolism B
MARMERPDDRPLKHLPTLEANKAALETCTFCPKLCRSACPVSNAEPRESLTPWGKMSLAYGAATGSVERTHDVAQTAWACTGCFGCREHCDHKNEVGPTLLDARDAYRAAGLVPPEAQGVLDGFDAHARDTVARAAIVADRAGAKVAAGAKTAVLVGCAYLSRAQEEATHAVLAAAELQGAPVSVVDACCGLPLLHAGDKARFLAQAALLDDATKGAERVVVVDPGCAVALRVYARAWGVTTKASVELLVELAAAELGRLSPISFSDGPVRYHDPCQLGRGLGVYEAPRAILTRALGRAPDEFFRKREDGRCSGAGGLLPVTMPDVARATTRRRLDDHAERGGGTIVTACASSLSRFRGEGAQTIDLSTVLARALGAV